MTYPPVIDGGRQYTPAINYTQSVAQAVQMGANDSKGSYTVNESDVPFDCWGITIVAALLDYAVNCLTDIAIGSGTEQIIIPNMLFPAFRRSYAMIHLPIFIPEGEEVSVRGQDSSTGTNYNRVGIVYHGVGAGGGWCPLYNEVYEMGADTTDTSLTTVDAGASANNYGAYTEIESSTPIDFDHLIIGIGNLDDFSRSAATYTFKLAIGSASSEIDIFECPLKLGASLSPTPDKIPIWQYIPTGTRLSIALSSSTTDSTDRLLEFQIHGFGGGELSGGGRYATSGIVSSSSSGTNIATSTANTKTGYTQLESSVPFDVQGFYTCIVPDSTSVGFLVDIAVGAGTEQIIVPDVYVNGTECCFYYFPIFIPEGEEVSIRAQSDSASDFDIAMIWRATGSNSNFPMLNKCANMGGDTSDTTLVSVDAGSTANTYGAWTEITSSTPRDFSMLKILLGNQQNTGRGEDFYLFKLGIGGAGSEVMILEVPFHTEGGHDIPIPDHFDVWQFIPAGTRLSIAIQSQTTDASNRLVDFEILGFGG